MSVHLPDATNASITVSGTTGVTVAATSAMGVINEWAVVIGLVISLMSLIVGVCFKVSASRKEAARRDEELKYREAESKRAQQQIDALTAMVESVITRDGIERRQDPR